MKSPELFFYTPSLEMYNEIRIAIVLTAIAE
jgi:hypothetical protein